ncbi:MAG: hypothetical protein N3F66_00965 [Spirochaetes bacterium]|nr:hypothetical protein [Spirochaetota bacterium]
MSEIDDFSFDDDLFKLDDEIDDKKSKAPTTHRLLDEDIEDIRTVKESTEISRKRSSRDFQPDMDALLITAQSSMIIEGMKKYSERDFSAANLPIYLEALNGVNLYIKILDRNPKNYHKLKAVINADPDCQEVEKIAFNLYKKMFGTEPETDQEKLVAFEKFSALFKDAVNRATIATSMKEIKKYFLLSGGLDEIKVTQLVAQNDEELRKDISNLQRYIAMGLAYIEKGNIEIIKGLKGRDLNNFVVRGSQLLAYYFKLIHNERLADYYARINSIYSKYFVIKE